MKAYTPVDPFLHKQAKFGCNPFVDIVDLIILYYKQHSNYKMYDFFFSGEFLFLCFGIYLCYCVRQAPSDYGEIRYISMAIYLETVFSGLLHILRYINNKKSDFVQLGKICICYCYQQKEIVQFK